MELYFRKNWDERYLVIIIQTTIGSEEDARELTNYLVKQLIACGTFQDSIHLQNGKGNPTNFEYEINLYSKESLHDQLIETLQEKHTYELPKITTIKPTYTLPEYDDWVNKELFNYFSRYPKILYSSRLILLSLFLSKAATI